MKSSSSEERLGLLRSIADLFLGDARQFSDETVAVFDDVLSRLVTHIEARALAELSVRLAPVPTAPVGVVRRLAADDDIQVAGPVLQHSTRLTTEDLIEIASTKDQQHLSAIASRKVVEERVSDILVDRGDSTVAIAIARNAGARFSSGGFSRLVTRAEREEGIAELVAGRPEISTAQLRSLVEKATDTIRRRLTAQIAPAARARLDGVLARIASDLDEQDKGAPRRDYTAALRFAQSMQADPDLMRVTLHEFAQTGAVEQTVALLSVLSGVPVPAVERILVHSDEGGAIILCRSVGVDWAAASLVLDLRVRMGCAGRLGREAAMRRYNGLDAGTAQRVVRFWRVRALNTQPDRSEAADAPA